MATYQFTSGMIGLVIAAIIVWLVRRDHLHGKYAIWWLAIAGGFAVLGLAPSSVDTVASRLGISYPPILVVVLGFGILVLKIILMDIERSKSIVKLHRLAQRLAILEAELAIHQDSADRIPNQSEPLESMAVNE